MTHLRERLLISSTRLDTLVPNQSVAVTSDHIAVKVHNSRRVAPEAVRTLAVEPVCPQAVEQAVAFERETFDRYLPMLAGRLNAIHGCQESETFWTSVIGSTLLTHIAACRRVFDVARMAEAGDYDMERLDEGSFQTPSTEAAHLDYFIYSELGDEQLFSILGARLLTGRLSKTFEASGEWGNFGAPQGRAARYARRARQIGAVSARHPSIYLQQALVTLRLRRVQPTLLAAQCFWSRATKLRMQVKSGGRIAIDDRPLQYKTVPANTQSAARDRISAAPPGATAFDRFAIGALRWSAPTSWIENYRARRDAAESRLTQWSTIRSIANESQNEDSSLLLAVARQRGIEILYCEHNYLQHQFPGHLVWLLSRKTDRYLSLGWSRPEFPKVEPAGSLFGWSEPERRKRNIDLLFVAGVAIVRGPITMSGYADAGDNAPAYFRTTANFLDALSPAARKRMYYRDYPADRRAVLGLHAREQTFLERYKDSFETLDRLGHETTSSLMSRSRLVVINYLSTAYNEALMADVPTIVLYNPETYQLRAEESHFYDDLVEAGVFQATPESAAELVERIIDDPRKWWDSAPVRYARDRYVAQNFAGREPLERKLLDAAGLNGVV